MDKTSKYVLFLFSMFKEAQSSFRRRHAPTPRKKPLPDLPVYYYHSNFTEMLSFVRDRYSGAMGKDHLQFLSDFQNLSHLAQCLYIRMAGRKGSVFDLSKLKYEEIGDLYSVSDELSETGFARQVAAHDFEDYISVLTKTDLVSILSSASNEIAFKKSAKKDELLRIVHDNIGYDSVAVSDRYLTQGRQNELQFISFLYFGKIQDNLQNFTLRDLGLIKVPDFKTEYAARFHNYDEAYAAYFYAKSLETIKSDNDRAITELMDSYASWPVPESESDFGLKDELLFRLGKICEQADDQDMALMLYGQVDGPKCREREMRLRYKLGDKGWCEARLETMIDTPVSDSEYDFAIDFYARKFGKKRTSQMTDLLRGGINIEVDEALRHLPEYAAGRFFERAGFEVYRSENDLWRMLFGLLFWSELFNAKKSAVHTAFDRRPKNLNDGTFYDDFKSQIETKLSSLTDVKTTQLSLLKSFSRYNEKPNGIFQWSHSDFDMVNAFVSHASASALAAILRQICQNYRGQKDGYPDLMRIKDGNVSFIEVKAPGDVIRRNQLTRIRQLREAGFEVDIGRIKWSIDPQQTYVVVDIETTGGGRGNHRITEIGAVKVQAGKVIDEFQTLLNPERHVPAFITRLTGISNDMVKDAPLFEDKADKFRQFLEGSIFVAHNVNFDYGFIREEYARLGRPFKYPKMCTVSSMRTFYPGLKSYSLANLCKEFAIDLTGHHRAMVDARAAAELLFLVNDKRLEEASIL